MPKFSIIIPVCGHEEMTKECVESIKKNSTDFEIIMVFNGPGICSLGFDYAICNEKNLGFPIAVNQGIKKATGEIIVILNNDVIVTPGWLDHLADHLQYADMVGPVTNEISGPQKVFADVFGNTDSLNRFAHANYERNKLQSTSFHRLVFFCVAIKREVIEKVGLLDEDFSPGNFEDDDFCFRAIDAGFRLVIAEDVFVFHYGSVTHKALKLDYAKLLQTNRAKFEIKWPIEKQSKLREKCITNFK
jgi:GT2 family glycosyltransferase